MPGSLAHIDIYWVKFVDPFDPALFANFMPQFALSKINVLILVEHRASGTGRKRQNAKMN